MAKTQTFTQGFAVGSVLKSSTLLAAFFETEFPKLTKPVRWVRDMSLPEGINGRSTRGDEEDLIRLRVVPAEDPTLVAHELAHLVLTAEGFPATGGAVPSPGVLVPYDFESLSAALNSMLHHPLVHDRLLSYGFDVSGTFEKEAEESKRQLRRESGEPSDQFKRVHWAINYAQQVLTWDSLGQNQEPHSYLNWFDQRFPRVAQEGKNLVRVARRQGFDTPSKQQTLFAIIIRRFKLDQPDQWVRLGPLL